MYDFIFSIHPPPAFGSSTNLEALALEASRSQGQDHDSNSDNGRLLYRYSLLLVLYVALCYLRCLFSWKTTLWGKTCPSVSIEI
jgi:hypothetical protein